MKPQEQVEVTLAKAHIHAGKAYPAGSRIQVSALEKAWLETVGAVSTIDKPITDKKEAAK